MRFLLLLIALCYSTGLALGQKSWTVVYDDEEYKSGKYGSKSQAVISITNTYALIVAEGYADCRMDTLVSDSTIAIKIDKGIRYSFRSLKWSGDTIEGNIIPVRRKKYPSFDARSVLLIGQQKIVNYENNGYPFARIDVGELTFTDGLVDATLTITRGQRVLMDSLIIKSEQKMPVRYISNYLNFRHDEPYKEDQVSGFENKIKEIPFLQTIRPPEVLFKTEGQADVFLYLKKKKANYFNGILGIRPDDVTGRVNLTGDVEIKLLNSLNTGEELYLNWRKLQAQTQDLTVRANLPFIFNIPVGIDGLLKIYKRDSTFSSVKSAAGLVLQLGGRDRLKVFLERNQATQLSTFTNVQALGNINSTLYGLALQKEKLDYLLNPRKGYSLTLEGAVGNRKINSNNLTDINAGNPSSAQQYRVETAFAYYQPTLKKQCFKVAVSGSTLISENLFDNEMYRFGGLRTMRGIDEESIFATSFAVITAEYRLLFEQNSALYLFLDQGWYEKQGVASFTTDTPISYGAGVNFETKAGIFAFNYALGQQYDNPVLVRNAKVSFGFTSIF